MLNPLIVIKFKIFTLWINTYNYSNIKATHTNKNSSNEVLASTTSNESVIYVSNSNYVRVYSWNATEIADASSNLENSKYYGVNLSFLVNKAKGQIQNFNISRNAVRLTRCRFS